MARTLTLTKVVHNRIIAAVRNGASVEVAAQAAGVSKSAVYNWLAWGREPDAEPHFVELVEALEKASGENQTRLIAVIQKATATTWQAAAWMLERKYPDQWGRKDRIAGDTLKEREAERIARQSGLEKEEVLASIDRLLSGSN